uniref:Uncharacterized protein n=1 Tax=Glossina pallidipes TaxID=7398 RepID=A0A1A9ZUY2_GLOPL
MRQIETDNDDEVNEMIDNEGEPVWLGQTTLSANHNRDRYHYKRSTSQSCAHGNPKRVGFLSTLSTIKTCNIEKQDSEYLGHLKRGLQFALKELRRIRNDSGQKLLHTVSVLISGLSGAGAEITKNITLCAQSN